MEIAPPIYGWQRNPNFNDWTGRRVEDIPISVKVIMQLFYSIIVSHGFSPMKSLGSFSSRKLFRNVLSIRIRNMGDRGKLIKSTHRIFSFVFMVLINSSILHQVISRDFILYEINGVTW